MDKFRTLTFAKAPDLYEWEVGFGDAFYHYDGENVVANYNGKIGNLEEISTLPVFYIKKSHYKSRMDNIVRHMNYFTKFYDIDRESYFSMMSMKYFIDTNLNIPQAVFLEKMLKDVITPSFISKCKLMACNLYTLNINTDSSGKFNNVPKITNAQAFQIIATSFCFKIITPIMLHFANTNTNFDISIKTEYLKWFNKLFNRIIKKFEINDTPFYTSLCKFVVNRGEKLYRNNMTAFYQKKMLRGDTLELYNDILIREVVCVKTLYKLDYRMSCVSFIDGVVHKFNSNYLKENYTSKPYEIDSENTSRDSDESLSHAEALEQATYKRDESSVMIADVNTAAIVSDLKRWYNAFDITPDEFKFYYDNFKPNAINKFLFESFYAGKFKDPYAVANLNRGDTVYLMICMKKIFQHYKMYYLSQLATARVYGKYKENMIRNTRFLEKVTSSQMYKDIIEKKYSNLLELQMKESPILKPLSNMLNSIYTLVDFDDVINGRMIEHVDQDMVANDYLIFLSVI